MTVLRRDPGDSGNSKPNGTLKNGLFIREEVLDALYKNGNVKDVKEIVELLGKVKNDKTPFRIKKKQIQNRK